VVANNKCCRAGSKDVLGLQNPGASFIVGFYKCPDILVVEE
jgi:hypothetical protein